MNIIAPYGMLMSPHVTGAQALLIVEGYGRVSWKSEDKAVENSAPRFVKMLITKGHESVLEHVSVSVKFVVDRGVSHELVRHRIASFTQESTRYCDYVKRGSVTFIRPPFWEENSMAYRLWLDVMEHAEANYNGLIALGATAQEARSVLPNSLKTEIVVTTNFREWRHIFTLRAAKAAHPQMREVMLPLLSTFQQTFPVFFDDIVPK